MKISDISEEFWRKEPAKFSDSAVGGRKSDRLLALQIQPFHFVVGEGDIEGREGAG